MAGSFVAIVHGQAGAADRTKFKNKIIGAPAALRGARLFRLKNIDPLTNISQKSNFGNTCQLTREMERFFSTFYASHENCGIFPRAKVEFGERSEISFSTFSSAEVVLALQK